MPETEPLFPFEPVDMVELAIEIGGTAFTLTHTNTEIYTYRRHPEVNHVYHSYFEDHQDRQIAVFDCMPLIEQLRELCFGERILPRPTDWDEKAFEEYNRKTLEKELEALGED